MEDEENKAENTNNDKEVCEEQHVVKWLHYLEYFRMQEMLYTNGVWFIPLYFLFFGGYYYYYYHHYSSWFIKVP